VVASHLVVVGLRGEVDLGDELVGLFIEVEVEVVADEAVDEDRLPPVSCRRVV